jgi:hypothetical protein
MAQKAPAKAIDPLYRILRRFSNPDQEGSAISEGTDGVWSMVYVGG